MAQGFDIIIVSTRNASQEEFWHKRLRSRAQEILKPGALILTVSGNWSGDAGTGLGMLYAYQKAVEKAKFKYHRDVLQMHKAGASVALYHAAGDTKELFPLTASEKNSIANLHIPSPGGNLLETIIEHTNRQYANGRSGRLSIFPCDRILYPAHALAPPLDSHISLLCRSQPQQLAGKQLIALDSRHPKVFDTQEPIVLKTKLPIATNLSSFSLSWEMTCALLAAFKQELEQESGYMDANAHFWMPLTLDYATYLSVSSYPQSQMHFHRMQDIKKRFLKQNPQRPFLQTLDIGAGGHWWDFGSVDTYYHSLLELTKETPGGHLMRNLFALQRRICPGGNNRVIADQHSLLIGTNIYGGSIKNSVLIGVSAESLTVENAVIINCRFASLQSSKALLYNVEEPRPLKLAAGTVRADVAVAANEQKYQMYSQLGRDGKIDWNTALPQNPLSFSEIHQLIENS